MPHTRQYRLIGAVIFFACFIIYYSINGARQTRQSDFYTKTAAALEAKRDALARSALLDDERHRLVRADQIRKEHDGAVSTSSPLLTTSETEPAVAGRPGAAQQPIGPDVNGAGRIAGDSPDAERNVAGRVKVKDDRLYEGRPATADPADGVANIGNIGAKETDVAKDGPKTAKAERVEDVLNEILKKGPVIIFSKTYCPHSKKAKNILQNLYTIEPEPYVVELDEHELGPELQNALQDSTGRRTVPNVLVNGKSIGGGDDVYNLHASGKLIDKIQSMGGKRITSVVANTKDDVPESNPGGKKALKFKA